MIRRRDLKKKHKEERIKRIEALKTSPENNEFKLFKINSNCENLPSNYKGFDFFNDKEITMGRKCLANGWGYPPVEFFTFDKMPDPPVNENEMKLKSKNEFLFLLFISYLYFVFFIFCILFEKLVSSKLFL